MGTILHKDFKTNCKEKNYEEIRKMHSYYYRSKRMSIRREREREEGASKTNMNTIQIDFKKLISLLYNSILSRFNKCQIINKISIPKKKN